MNSGCKRAWQADALRDGQLSGRDAEAFARHAASCTHCQARKALDERVRRAAAGLPIRPVDPLHVRRIRQRLLETAHVPRQPPRSRRLAIVAISFALIGIALIFGFRFRGTGPTIAQAPVSAPLAAQVIPAAGTRWSSSRDGSTERIRLSDGALTLHVRRREPGERFLVDLPDGEIEVHGTEFRVAVSAARTHEIVVYEGVVAFRRQGAPELLLAAGGRWPTAAPPVDEGKTSPEPPHAPAPSASIAHSARAFPRTSGDDEDERARRYAAAIALFDARRFDEAAAALHAFSLAHPKADEAEDAAFLESTALANAGRASESAAVAEHALKLYPHSIHARDAVRALIVSARDRGDCERARDLAERWKAYASSESLGDCAD